jgi:competence protein ComEC
VNAPPLFVAAIGLAAGVLLSEAHPALGVFTLPAAAAAVAGLAFLPGPAAALVPLGMFVMVGTLLGTAAARENAVDCRMHLPDGALLRVRGTIASLPRDSRAVLWLDSVQEHSCAGAVRVRLPGVWSVPAGARVEARGTWWSAPGDRSPARAGTLAIDSARALNGAGPWFLRARLSAQQRVQALWKERAPLVDALLLADTDGLTPDVRDRYAASGLAHLLAISGSHVVLVAALALLLCGILRLPAAPSAYIAAGITCAYVLFLGAPHPAARSAIQLLLVLAARRLQRPSHPLALLGCAALALLAVDPLAIGQAGFQLSFAGILGILVLGPRLSVGIAGLPRVLREPLAAGTAATLATMPVSAWHFGQIAPIGVIANLLAVPIVSLAVPALTLALLASHISAPAAAFLASGGSLLLEALDGSASLAAAAPYGHAWVSRQALIGSLTAVAIGWLLIRNLPRTSPRRSSFGRGPDPGMRPALRGSVAACAGLAGLIAWPLLADFTPARLEIFAIDVGQGDAIAVRTPDDRWVLVDAGPGGLADAGRRKLVPFLRRRGANRLEALILTHPHADHIGGAPAVFDALEVRTVVDPAMAFAGSGYLDVLRGAAAEGATWLPSRRGRELRIGEVVLTFLNHGGELDGTDDANEFSVAFRLSYRDFAAVFLGDAPAALERLISAREREGMRAQLLKVGHHGSATSTSAELLDAVRPQLAVISAGRQNRYGHPARATLERLEAARVRILRTDREGSLRITVAPDGSMQVDRVR